MSDIDISIYNNERRLEAMKAKLAEQGTTIETEAKNMMDVLYVSILPREVCDEIDAQIAKEQAEADAEREASKRFAVFHIRENGEDYHFTSELYDSFYSAACRYRIFSRSDTKAVFAAFFIGGEPINAAEFSKLCDAMNTDQRITSLIEFDLDEGTVSTCESGHDGWISYNLKDVSNAVYKTNRKYYQTSDMRQSTFDHSLAGKEIHYASVDEHETDDESEYHNEDEAPAMQM